MNTKHQTIFHTCTAVALPLVLMIGCSEREPVALERGAIPGTSNGMTLEQDSGSGIVLDGNGLYSIKVTTGASLVQQSPKNTAVTAPAMPVLYFETDKDVVAGADVDQLKQHAEFLRAHGRYLVRVTGHADERGTPAHNADLSARRARQVAALLTSFGVPAAQISVASFGASVPVGDPSHWDENRRVELLYADEYVLSAR